MPRNQGKSSKLKVSFHHRNKHQGKYNIKGLIKSNPDFSKHVIINTHGNQSIDFSNPDAVKALNKSLLKNYYGVEWDIPTSFLCPPIPGRADYVHHLSDLLSSKTKGHDVKCLDIGVGANCIYPIIGVKEYGWSFVGTEIDPKAINAANKTLEVNQELRDCIQLRLQSFSKNIFKGVIDEGEKFDMTMCNPPFHSSKEESEKGTLRKLGNLKGKKETKVTLNFGGTSEELWCDGGEVEFVKRMIMESKQYAGSCIWFTTLISKESNLKYAYRTLKTVNPTQIKTILMGQGQKQSRILAWSFVVKK